MVQLFEAMTATSDPLLGLLNSSCLRLDLFGLHTQRVRMLLVFHLPAFKLSKTFFEFTKQTGDLVGIRHGCRRLSLLIAHKDSPSH